MKTSSFLSALFGLAFLAGVAYGLFLLARLGGGLFDGVDREVMVVTSVAAAALLFAASVVGNGLHAVARRDEVRQQRASRTAVYAQVLRPRTDAAELSGVYGGPAPAEDAPGTNAQLLLHASPAVLAAYGRLRRAEEDAGRTDARQALAQLVRAMRRDLGHRGADSLPELAELLRSPERDRERV